MIDIERGRDGSPLCMLQYMDMLSCCRIPGEKVDTQRRSPIDQSCHIIIAHNGHVRLLYIVQYYRIATALFYQSVTLKAIITFSAANPMPKSLVMYNLVIEHSLVQGLKLK